MNLGITNRIAVVTGGSEGIGKAAATILAEEGVNVVILARTQSKLDAAVAEISQTAVGSIQAISCDVSDAGSVESAFDAILSEHGKVDILVNNAGQGNANTFDSLTTQIVDDDYALKVHGAMYCSKAALPSMQAQKWGRIINITTAAGKAAGYSTLPTAMSRAAGIAMTKSMSKEYGVDNILVNTVCIGSIRSAQNMVKAEEAVASGAVATTEDYYTERCKDVPVLRVGEAREAGDLIAYLASERASYISGTAINMDGGAAPVV
ncbi:SDR family NAD(P)-dependent oxidoreductase [Candidatus Lucifugimonas marina]|jgi:NAD(P)-dependent dehydrogenase (short-subunit alcohol dehydrogenase family)|uniref:SDR family oxidoreductase n=1 Tax=Candidatus Lucifugimonas marina TaxID=3038979 RepID=A0AAJ6CVZ3_9CHLR|nr:SDR family oxidoreductase [SAR202 cluster bacterium JH702]MDG0869320.1 SDR family oxidoreductase [SAR202 cluster bacterium JH639]WFG36720.1 SDR family oxidoreductase [SAR202 cluster bacterium JH545]WFG40654.1 SDR family oxidoreductase [SAR202 cluster bacterium JH1073]